MSEPFNLVSVADFERMSRTEKERYLQALVAHLRAIEQLPLADTLTLAAPGIAPGARSKDN